MIQSEEIGSIVSPKLDPKKPILHQLGQEVEVILPKKYERPERYRFKTYHVIGEEAGLRKTDIRSIDDVENMWQIEQSEGMIDWINESPEEASNTKKELKEWIKDKSYDDRDPKKGLRNSYVRVYAITKNDQDYRFNQHGEIPDEKLRKRQKIEGWIRIDGSSANVGENEERHRYERIMRTTLPRSKDYPSPIELTYIKRPGGPPHLMPSAIRTACHMIAAQDGEVDRNFFYEQNGKIIPKRIVMAFIDPKNPSFKHSEKALIESGFERVVRNDIRYKVDDPKKEQKYMYVLNWERFQEIREKIERKNKIKLLNKLNARIQRSTPDSEEIQKETLKRLREKAKK